MNHKAWKIYKYKTHSQKFGYKIMQLNNCLKPLSLDRFLYVIVKFVKFVKSNNAKYRFTLKSVVGSWSHIFAWIFIMSMRTARFTHQICLLDKLFICYTYYYDDASFAYFCYSNGRKKISYARISISLKGFCTFGTRSQRFAQYWKCDC